MRIFCVIGEESGDNHSAQVLRRIVEKIPDVEIVGTGGEHFRKLSKETYYEAEKLSVIGFWEVMKKRKFFVNILEDLTQKIQEQKPEILFLVDYPGMNLRLAERVQSESLKIIYYISPQVWSWKKKRAFEMKRRIDLMINLFPFECTFLKDYANMDSVCFGHPILDNYEKIKDSACPFPKEEGLTHIAILPGSRPNEIKRFFPVLVKAMKSARKTHPRFRFYLMKAGQIPLHLLQEYGLDSVPEIQIVGKDRLNWIAHCDLAWCASGTASLECAVMKTPPIIFYQLSSLTFFIAKYFYKIKNISMANILLKRRVFPELLQNNFNAKNLIKTTEKILQERWLLNPENLIYQALHQSLGEPNSYQKTADHIVHFIQTHCSKKN